MVLFWKECRCPLKRKKEGREGQKLLSLGSGTVYKGFIKEVMKSKSTLIKKKKIKVCKVRCMQIRLFLKEVIKY